MLARNPKTGGLLRIIQSDASVWRDQKTIVWSESTTVSSNPMRFFHGCVGPEVFAAAVAAAQPVDILLLLSDPEWFQANVESLRRLDVLVIPKRFVEYLGLATVAAMKLKNLLCIDELHELYPYVGPAWDGTAEDAKAIVSLALRFGRAAPVCPLPTRAAAAATLKLRLDSVVPVPRPLWFITQYYQPSKRRRAQEIHTCIQRNFACAAIDKIVLLNEAASGLAPHPKLEEHVIGRRITYADVIRWIKDSAPPEAIVVFANADIYLDEESWLDQVWTVDLEDRCLALLRWDESTQGGEPTLFGPRADSQDTWAVTASSVQRRTWDWKTIEFPFGQGGCDNAFALEMFKQKFLVVNPALTLKTIHVHESAYRTYDPKDIVDKPAYLYIQPTGLHDLQPNYQIPKECLGEKLICTAFDRRLAQGASSEAQLRTWATMINRSLGEKAATTPAWTADGANRWAPKPVQLERRRNHFALRQGLVFTATSIEIGPSKIMRDKWSEIHLSSMAASIHVRRGLIAPLSDDVAAEPGRYVAEYLSKIFLLQGLSPASEIQGEFWCSRSSEAMEALQAFTWPTKEMPVLAIEQTPQAWCDESIVWPHVESEEDQIQKEQVTALRDRLRGGWVAAHEGRPRVVVVVDGVWVTDEMATQLEKELTPTVSFDVVWTPSTSIGIVAEKLRGAWGCVVASGAALSWWTWVLPIGAHVWDVQSEMKPSAALLGLAAAAGLVHKYAIVPKCAASGPTESQRQELFVRLGRSMFHEIQGGHAANAANTIPRLILPAQGQKGFFSHAGDSFREMARVWAAKGWVQLVEDPDATQVWLEGVGETLLYDRPTLEWLRAAPPTELKWKRALFGNPAPLAGESAWTFWPRRPELVETLVAAGVPQKSSRTRNLVFYGRSENAVQRGHRTGADWSAAFGPSDEFIHVEGDSKYPFTQEEYLHRLATSRFGLCLAGYGKKCHREIECMAMGTVPIVAPEVDMSNYAESPIEGTHFFRATGPEEAQRLATETGAERWSTMSVACQEWWRRNASVAGSWELTRRLAGI